MSMVIKGLWEVLNLSVDALSSETLPYSQSYIITFPSFSLIELSKIKTDLLSLRNIYHTQEKCKKKYYKVDSFSQKAKLHCPGYQLLLMISLYLQQRLRLIKTVCSSNRERTML